MPTTSNVPGPGTFVVIDVAAGEAPSTSSTTARWGFAREGLDVDVVPASSDRLGTLAAGTVVVVDVTGEVPDLVLRPLRDRLADGVRVLAIGAGNREAMWAAGADEALRRPVGLREIVTVGRLLSIGRAQGGRSLQANLGDLAGMLTLIRALCALGRSGVLSLAKDLRRGEIRFHRGEVSSAQVGVIHGQAALHQLLLWTDARLEFRLEEIVRWQQIPLSHDELMLDAERFLDGVRELSGGVSPAAVLEQDVAKIHKAQASLPEQVKSVLKLFDGHRVVADILEESPFRVFETLRVTRLAQGAGLLRPARGQKPRATWRAMLAIEEWLVGGAAVSAATLDTGPVPRASADAGSGPVAPAIPVEKIQWGELLPRTSGYDVGTVSGVVPTRVASGEIMVPKLPPGLSLPGFPEDAPSREQPREGLEAAMDTEKRERVFSVEVAGAELQPPPSVRAKRASQSDLPAIIASDTPTPPIGVPALSVGSAIPTPMQLADTPPAGSRAARASAPNLAMLSSMANTAEPKQRTTPVPTLPPVKLPPLEPVAEPAAAESNVRKRLATPVTEPDDATTPTPRVEVDAIADVSGEIGASAAPAHATQPVASGPSILVEAPVEPPAEPPKVAEAPQLVTEAKAEAKAADPEKAAEEPKPAEEAKAAEPEKPAEPTKLAEPAEPEKLAEEPKPAEPASSDDSGLMPVAEASVEAATVSSMATTPPVAAKEIPNLTSDLARVHFAASRAEASLAGAVVGSSEPPNSPEDGVSDVRRDAAAVDAAALALTEDEEAFFRAGQGTNTGMIPKIETFTDLDADYEPIGFWDKLRGKRPTTGR